VNSNGTFNHGTSIISTFSIRGGSLLDFLVMTEIIWPMSANLDDRWYTVEPIPPQRGGYSPEIIATCMLLPNKPVRGVIIEESGSYNHYNGSKIGPF
jgi:hypothetical protein